MKNYLNITIKVSCTFTVTFLLMLSFINIRDDRPFCRPEFSYIHPFYSVHYPKFKLGVGFLAVGRPSMKWVEHTNTFFGRSFQCIDRMFYRLSYGYGPGLTLSDVMPAAISVSRSPLLKRYFMQAERDDTMAIFVKNTFVLLTNRLLPCV